MTETKAPDYGAREEMAALEARRGLVAAEMEACGAELDGLQKGRGMLALDGILGDEGAADELEARDRRREYLARRAALCEEATAYADEYLEGLRRTYLGAAQAAGMPLEEIPEVLRERVREAREAEGGTCQS